MALRTRYAGSGLGLKPISIGDDPYSADSEFDSTVRIPSTKSAPRIPPPPSIAPNQAAGILPPTQPPNYPAGMDPQSLNYEGRTPNLGVPPTTYGVTLDQQASLDALKKWGGPSIGTGLTNILGKTVSQERPNPDYQIHYLQQELFNTSLDRLKQAGAAGARDQDEEVMALLASRGLLNSGIAAKVLGQLQAERDRNLYEAANKLNEMLLSGDISRLTAKDLAQFEADLQKRNAESLAKLQAALTRSAQPDPLAQILGTGAGIAASFLSSGAKSSSSGSKLYGEEDPGFRVA